MKFFLPIISFFCPLMGLCQETATDTIQKIIIVDTILPLPYSATTAATDANIERALSKSWEARSGRPAGYFPPDGIPPHVYYAGTLHRSPYRATTKP